MNTGLRLIYPRPVSMASGLTACGRAPEWPHGTAHSRRGRHGGPGSEQAGSV